MPQSIEIIAHRGFSAAAPENTLSALEAALEAGADAVEFDLHTAACGTPVLFHDAMLSRTTNGVGPLRRLTLGQLKALDAGRWFSPAFEGERIPSFAEALESLRGRIGRVYAEMKGYRELEDLDRMVHIARDSGMLASTTFISLNWTTLDRVRSKEPGLTIGYIVDEEGTLDEALQRAAGDAHALVDLRADLLDDAEVARRASAAGVDLAVWTVDDPRQASRVLESGVRRVTTNQVTELVAWKRGL